jgi:hypothetical protein
MIIVPFEPEHFNLLELQDKQGVFKDLITQYDYGVGLKSGGVAWSMIEESTLCCIGCAGIIDAGFGRGIAWALLSKDAKKHMFRITKEVKKRLVGFKRIEITVNFDEAHRWAEMLGFKCEAAMKSYCNGETHYLYSRVF